MVDVTPLIPAGRKIIQSYAPGVFKISGETYNGPVLVYPDRIEIWDNAPDDAQNLDLQNFSQLIAAAATIDVLLLGTGAGAVFVPPLFRSALKEGGLIVEAMGTGAACRTYNVLLAEGRRVAAALLPVSE